MRIPHGPGGFGLIGGIFADVLAGLVFIICFIIVVGLLVVLVRFLLVATKAAEIYVSKNSPPGQVTPPATPATPAAAQTTETTPTTPVAKAPTTTRTRTPKAPPTT
jgi:hypothetical protein